MEPKRKRKKLKLPFDYAQGAEHSVESWRAAALQKKINILYRRSTLRLYDAHDCDSIIFSCTDVACNVSTTHAKMYRRD